MMTARQADVLRLMHIVCTGEVKDIVETMGSIVIKRQLTDAQVQGLMTQVDAAVRKVAT